MRVTQKTRLETRRRLLEQARALFGEVGFDAATTREVARRAGVAAGTLFNYFASKEALGAALLAEACAAAEEEFDASRRAGESLEERLFAWVAIQLRSLLPFRSWVAEVLDAGASLLRSGGAGSGGTGSAGGGDDGERFRVHQLERIQAWLLEAGRTRESLIDLHLWWTLYLGVLDFWTRDESDNQEATLALLDRSTELFGRGLREDPGRS